MTAAAATRLATTAHARHRRAVQSLEHATVAQRRGPDRQHAERALGDAEHDERCDQELADPDPVARPPGRPPSSRR